MDKDSRIQGSENSSAAAPTKPQATIANIALIGGVGSVAACFFLAGGFGVLVFAPAVLGYWAIGSGIIAFTLAKSWPTRFQGASRSICAIAIGSFIALNWHSLWLDIHYLRFEAVCASNLRGIGQGIQAYHDEHGSFPSSIDLLVSNRLTTVGQFRCPLAQHPEGRKSDYVYVTNLKKDDPPHWILMYDYGRNHPNRTTNVLYVDGHVEKRDSNDFIEEFAQFREEFIAARGYPPELTGAVWP